MTVDKFKEGGYTYFRLYARCPICIEKGIQSQLSYWNHYDNDCYGDIYVGDNAFFKCKKCGSEAHVSICRYVCPCHSKSLLHLVSFCGPAPWSGLVDEFVSTLVISLVARAGIEWCQKFLTNLYQHGEWR